MIKTVLYDYSDAHYDFKPGAILNINADFKYPDVSKLSKGIFLTASVTDGLEIVDIGKDFEFKYIHRYIANAAEKTADAIYSSDTSALIKAVILGDKADIYNDSELGRAFSVTGVAHVIAVSGMHVSFLVGLVFFFIKNRKTAIPIVILVILLFAGITGFPASVVRAVVMQTFVLLAYYIRRETDPITFLSAALLILLLVNPYSILNLGLQLSFLATFGLIKFSPKIKGWLDKKLCTEKVRKSKFVFGFLSFVSSSLSASLSASVMTVPLTALYFGNFSLIAPIANLLILWAVSIMFSFGSISLVLGSIYIPVGAVASVPAALAAKYITVIVRFLGSLNGMVIYAENQYLGLWFAAVYIAGILLVSLKASKKVRLIIISISIILFIITVSLPIIINDAADISITALDVGQGQCVVITSDDITAIVDCGGNRMESAGDKAADYLSTISRGTVDVLVISHFDSDHTNGAERLFERLEIKTVLLPETGLIPSSNEEKICALANEEGSDIIYIENDFTVNFKDGKMDIIAETAAGNGRNNNGLIVLCSKNDFRALIMGDANDTVEEKLVDNYDVEDIDVLVVGHHGAGSSTSWNLLAECVPKYALISVGDNSYGHPDMSVLERLEVFEAEVYITEKVGDITISSKDRGLNG